MKLHISLIATLMAFAGQASADMVIVANPHVAMNSIPRSELRRLFLGETSTLKDGSHLVPMDVTGDYRNAFYQGMLKKSPEQMSSYWARMIFTGKGAPPQQVSPKDVRSVVASTPGAISYLDSSQVDSSVKVITIVGDNP